MGRPLGRPNRKRGRREVGRMIQRMASHAHPANMRKNTDVVLAIEAAKVLNALPNENGARGYIENELNKNANLSLSNSSKVNFLRSAIMTSNIAFGTKLKIQESHRLDNINAGAVVKKFDVLEQIKEGVINLIPRDIFYGKSLLSHKKKMKLREGTSTHWSAHGIKPPWNMLSIFESKKVKNIVLFRNSMAGVLYVPRTLYPLFYKCCLKYDTGLNAKRLHDRGNLLKKIKEKEAEEKVICLNNYTCQKSKEYPRVEDMISCCGVRCSSPEYHRIKNSYLPFSGLYPTKENVFDSICWIYSMYN